MGQLQCPHCGVFTAAEPEWFDAEVQIAVASFSVSTVGKAIQKHRGKAHAVTEPEGGQPTYGIMVCQSCKKRFVAQEAKSGIWTAVHPITHRTVPDEIPEPIKSEFEEAQLCAAVGAHRACATMCAISAEAAWHEQKVSGLEELKEKGTLSTLLYDQANEVRLWNNIVKHELISEPVTEAEAQELLGYVGDLLHAIYVQPKRLSQMTAKREELKKGT